MASVKVKFRPSTTTGKEGTIYYQVIHNRVVRQIYTDYKLFASNGSPIPKRLSCIVFRISKSGTTIYFDNLTHQMG